MARNKFLNKFNHTLLDRQLEAYRLDGLKPFDPNDTQRLLPSGEYTLRFHRLLRASSRFFRFVCSLSVLSPQVVRYARVRLVVNTMAWQLSTSATWKGKMLAVHCFIF